MVDVTDSWYYCIPCSTKNTPTNILKSNSVSLPTPTGTLTVDATDDRDANDAYIGNADKISHCHDLGLSERTLIGCILSDVSRPCCTMDGCVLQKFGIPSHNMADIGSRRCLSYYVGCVGTTDAPRTDTIRDKQVNNSDHRGCRDNTSSPSSRFNKKYIVISKKETHQSTAVAQPDRQCPV